MGNKNDLTIAYSEVYEILCFMEQKYVDMIPKKLLDLFYEEKDRDYKIHINPNIPLTEQNLQKKTLALLAMLNLHYWCESETEKQELLKLCADNDKKKEEELREKYNPDNLFKKKEINKSIESEESAALIEYKEENFFKKVLNKIMSLFRKR